MVSKSFIKFLQRIRYKVVASMLQNDIFFIFGVENQNEMPYGMRVNGNEMSCGEFGEK